MRLENTFLGAEGVGPKTEQRLWEAGVTHWDAFDPGVVGPTRAARIESFLAEARDRLAARDATYFERTLPDRERWRLYENFRDEALFFDIETTGLGFHNDVTTVSLHQAGDTTTLVRGRDLTAERLQRAFADAAVIVTYNGARFDVPFLETAFDIAIDVPHLDLLYSCRRLGLTGGLSTVERQLGIERDRPDISGADAVRLWYDYAHDGDETAIETLVAYNREDTEHLQPIMDHVTAALHDRVFVPATDGIQARLDGHNDFLS